MMKTITAMPTTMPTTAPVDRPPPPLEPGVWLLGKVDPVGVVVVVVVADVDFDVPVADVAGFVEVDDLVVVWGLPERNAARAVELVLSFAGDSRLAGQEPLVHGLLVQHPRNGGVFFWHEYHCAVLLLHACAGMSLKLSPEYDSGLMLFWGQMPLPAAQGLLVQHPTNSFVLPVQM